MLRNCFNICGDKDDNVANGGVADLVFILFLFIFN